MRTDIHEQRVTTADLAGVATAEPRESVHEREGAPPAPLFPHNVADEFRGKWDHIQAAFVDEPRNAVQHADELVASAIKRLAETFAGERNKLEEAWSKGKDVSTEDLRVALQRYRSFFHRLLSV